MLTGMQASKVADLEERGHRHLRVRPARRAPPRATLTFTTMKTALLLAAGAGSVAGTTVELPRVSFHRKLHLPLAGSAVAGNYNLIFVSDEGA